MDANKVIKINDTLYLARWSVDDRVYQDSLISSDLQDMQALQAFIASVKDSPHPLAKLTVYSLTVKTEEVFTPTNPQSLIELGVEE